MQASCVSCFDHAYYGFYMALMQHVHPVGVPRDRWIPRKTSREVPCEVPLLLEPVLCCSVWILRSAHNVPRSPARVISARPVGAPWVLSPAQNIQSREY